MARRSERALGAGAAMTPLRIRVHRFDGVQTRQPDLAVRPAFSGRGVVGGWPVPSILEVGSERMNAHSRAPRLPAKLHRWRCST